MTEEVDVEGMIGAGRDERALASATTATVAATARSTRGSAPCSFGYPCSGSSACARSSRGQGRLLDETVS